MGRAQACGVIARVVCAAILLGLSGPSIACRCEQLPLAEYFKAADVVAMARLLAVQAGDRRHELRFELLGDAYKGRHRSGDELRVTTASSSAACGIAIDVGAVYVVFGHQADDRVGLTVDTCSGTRIHFSSALDAPRGFADVPAKFVASQLIVLESLQVLRRVAASAPAAADANNESLVGLLELKALAHGGTTSARPQADINTSAILSIESYNVLETREVGYELPAAVVYAVLPGWYKIRHNTAGFVWVAAQDAGTYFGYGTLPVSRLAYLTHEWSGIIWAGPGAGAPIRAYSARSSQPDEQAVNILESTIIGGMPWFRVEILDHEPCTGSEASPRLSGWIPAYGAAGQPNAWFYSRGC